VFLAHFSLTSGVRAREMLQWDLCMKNENGQVISNSEEKAENVQSYNFSVAVVCTAGWVSLLACVSCKSAACAMYVCVCRSVTARLLAER